MARRRDVRFLLLALLLSFQPSVIRTAPSSNPPVYTTLVQASFDSSLDKPVALLAFPHPLPPPLNPSASSLSETFEATSICVSFSSVASIPCFNFTNTPVSLPSSAIPPVGFADEISDLLLTPSTLTTVSVSVFSGNGGAARFFSQFRTYLPHSSNPTSLPADSPHGESVRKRREEQETGDAQGAKKRADKDVRT